MRSDLQAIILDIDSTLIDTGESLLESWRLAFSEFGVIVDAAALRVLIGTNADTLLPASVGIDPYSPVGRAIERRRRAIFMARFRPHLKSFPGARDLLRRLHNRGLHVVLATVRDAAETAALLDVLDAARDYDVVVTSADQIAGARDHDLVRAAMRKAGTSPERTVMVGGTPFDQSAAAKAGVPFIALLSAGWPADTFGGAIAVYDSPVDMLSHCGEPNCPAEDFAGIGI